MTQLCFSPHVASPVVTCQVTLDGDMTMHEGVFSLGGACLIPKKLRFKLWERFYENVFAKLHKNLPQQEPTTLLCSCNGVFTSKVIFRLNFPLIRLPQEPDDQLQEIKLTS